MEVVPKAALKHWGHYLLIAGIITIGVLGGLQLNQYVNKAKTAPPAAK
jgi:acyl CoA:acetate/3-ketoacid CoA transferase beta subunit